MSSEQPDFIAQVDQVVRGMKDIAKVTWAIYSEHREVGFSKQQAFKIASEWFLRTNATGGESDV